MQIWESSFRHLSRLLGKKDRGDRLFPRAGVLQLACFFSGVCSMAELGV